MSVTVSRTRPMRPRHGSSLAELLIWITVTGILVAITVPAFTGLRERMNLDVSVQSLVSALEQARLRAQVTHQATTVKRVGVTAFRDPRGTTVALAEPSVFVPTGADEVTWNGAGPPVAAAEFKVSCGSYSKRVVVNAAGFVSVQ